MIVVSTIRKINEELLRRAEEISKALNIVYVPREKLSIQKLKEQSRADTVIVVHQDKLTVDLPQGELFFHPNMAQVRIKRLRNNGSDNMLDAMEIEVGMRVLDCTMGFAADAIISAYGVGEQGRVVGIEVNPIIAYVVQEGLRTYPASNPDLEAAMRRIEVVNQDYLDFLKIQPDNSFDVVYFDPMFRHPLMDSENLSPLRQLADPRPLSIQGVKEACRVAKYRVVLKENARSQEFSRLGFKDMRGGKYAPIAYGVINLNDRY